MGNPISEEGGFVSIELGILRGIGLIPKNGKFGARYGKNLHEFRDVGISYLHTKCASQGLDMDCVQYWSGHFGKLDPNKYDKFFNDKEFTFEQYKIAEPYLNILSSPNGLDGQKINKDLDDFKVKNEALEKRLYELEHRTEMGEKRLNEALPKTVEEWREIQRHKKRKAKKEPTSNIEPTSKEEAATNNEPIAMIVKKRGEFKIKQ
jgi:uncharacterized coiled-coil protein SlyX